MKRGMLVMAFAAACLSSSESARAGGFLQKFRAKREGHFPACVQGPAVAGYEPATHYVSAEPEVPVPTAPAKPNTDSLPKLKSLPE